MNRKIGAIWAGLVIAIIILSVAAYTIGTRAGYEQGTSVGFMQGNRTGYTVGSQVGYNAGWVEGNATGFRQGKEVGSSEAYLRGLKEGAGTGYNIRDPSYSEMQSFIANDHTEQHVYSSSYTCFNFCNDILANAFNSGYKAGLVYIEFSDGSHGVICFKTTDRGMVFIEPQSDAIIHLTINQEYQPEGYESFGVVESYTIIW